MTPETRTAVLMALYAHRDSINNVATLMWDHGLPEPVHQDTLVQVNRAIREIHEMED